MKRVLFAAAMACAALVLFLSDDAKAYPWMINHGYASCGFCHVDPSGAGQLTAYGRAQSDLIVRFHLDPKDLESGEASPTAGFAFGLMELPEWLNISSNFRGGGIAFGSTADVQKTQVRPLLMAADVNATVNIDRFVGHVSTGFGLRSVGPAVVWAPDNGQDLAWVSREHWLGAKFLDDALVVRAGRMPVPYGLRNNEHTTWVRQMSRSDTNIAQQHGVSVYYGNEFLRTEVMAILGNYQVWPDAFRERGYSGYVEWAPLPNVAVGGSSRATYAGFDIDTKAQHGINQSHGVFGRYAPFEWFTLLAELNGHHRASAVDLGKSSFGESLFVQADFIPLGGLHLMPAVESVYMSDGTMALPSVGAWGSVAFYPLPHTELRLDNTYRQSFAPGGGTVGAFASMLQVHFFL